MKGKWKTVTKTLVRTFALTVAQDPDIPVRGVAAMDETDATGRALTILRPNAKYAIIRAVFLRQIGDWRQIAVGMGQESHQIGLLEGCRSGAVVLFVMTDAYLWQKRHNNTYRSLA